VQSRLGQFVSGNFFQTFGISAWRGRLFTDADDVRGALPVAVISFHAWKDKYGSDPSVIGAPYDINGRAFSIIGVTPPDFLGAKVAASDMPDLWLPLTTEPLIAGASSRLENPGLAWLDLIGRVRPGTNPRTLEAQLQGELHQWLASHRLDMSAHDRARLNDQTLHLTPGGAGVSLMREQYQDGLRLLLIAAICVLLLACANIANLLLARNVRNARQTATRAAIGASPARLVREALIDSAVLAGIGGAGGIAVAWAGARLIVHLAFQDAWVPVSAAPSVPVLLFALAMSVMTALLFGSVPAWIASRADPMDAMRGSTGMAAETNGAQKTLAIAQVSVSVVLLSAAAMLGQSLYNLEHQNLGFAVDGRYLVSIDSKLSNLPQERQLPLFREIQTSLGAFPGVRSVSAALYAPMSGSYWSHDVRIAGQPEPGAGDDVSSAWSRVTPSFFETIGDRIVLGRPIVDTDNATARRVAVINEAFAKKFFRNENPIGRLFGPAAGRNASLYEIVGVAADVRYFPSTVHAVPMYFVPEAQGATFDDRELESRELWSHNLYNIVIWAPGNPPGLAAAVRDRLAAVAPDFVVHTVQPYGDVVRRRFAEQDMIASLTWLFGAIGLLLAAVGLYGITAYTVERRTAEIGVRMALGANRASVVGMVLRGAFVQVSVGLALGIPAAIVSGAWIASRLFDVRPWDPALLVRAALFLVAATLVAAFIPARRAAGLDPMRALRIE
jgi:predicted permease